MASTIYRRQSMAQLYEKLRAQDDDDDMAWLAQFSPDDKFDEPYVPSVPSPPALSTISSTSPASYSSGSSISDPGLVHDFSDDHFDSDSDTDVDPEFLSLDLPCTVFDRSSCSPSLFQPHDFTPMTEPTDGPYFPSIQEISPPQSRLTPPPVELDSSPLPTLPAPSVVSHRIIRSTRKSSARYPLPVVKFDFNEDVHLESDGDGSEDEYLPSPVLGSRKRLRSTRSAPGTVASSQKRSTRNASHKRPRHAPLPRNVQAASGIVPVSPATNNNPWACPYCKWVQRNHRTPDLKRHIRTHTRLQRPAQWVCCGVPVKDANSYNVPGDAKSYVWGGEVMTGGCCKEFSRRDALKRHLDNDHISCIGNFTAFASICEDEI